MSEKSRITEQNILPAEILVFLLLLRLSSQSVFCLLLSSLHYDNEIFFFRRVTPEVNYSAQISGLKHSSDAARTPFHLAHFTRSQMHCYPPFGIFTYSQLGTVSIKKVRYGFFFWSPLFFSNHRILTNRQIYNSPKSAKTLHLSAH